MAIALYTDGGLLGRNPTRQAITWAWCRVESGEIVAERCGWIRASELPIRPDVGWPEGTNNQAEYYAILDGLEHLGDTEHVTVWTDSRVAYGWWTDSRSSLRSIPADWRIRQNRQLRRRGAVTAWQHLHGHPIQRKLAEQKERASRGEDISQDGYSEYNVYVDGLCRSMTALAELALLSEREFGTMRGGEMSSQDDISHTNEHGRY